jgi:hypothetical protein
MKLPLAARLYVAAVLAAGVIVGAWFVPHTIAKPELFAALLFFSSLASALKVSLPLVSSGSTMSVSYAVDFAAVLLLGADLTMLVAAASAWSQCTFRTTSNAAAYRTLFSMASLVLTVKVAGLVYVWLGGRPPSEPFSLLTIPKPLVGAATAYFICNTALIATAIGLSTRQSIPRVWNENFLWSAPSYFVVAGAAAVAASARRAAAGWRRRRRPALSHECTVENSSDGPGSAGIVRQVPDLHLATIAAGLIDAKDRRPGATSAGAQHAAGLAGARHVGTKSVKTAARP